MIGSCSTIQEIVCSTDKRPSIVAISPLTSLKSEFVKYSLYQVKPQDEVKDNNLNENSTDFDQVKRKNKNEGNDDVTLPNPKRERTE